PPTLLTEGEPNSFGPAGAGPTSLRMQWLKPDCDPVQRFAIRSTWDAAIKRRAAGHLKDGHLAMSASEKIHSAPGMECSKIPALVAEYASAATKAIGSKSILTQQEARCRTFEGTGCVKAENDHAGR
ncbi:MAG: hypothetical protein ACPIOQ_66280, partial [Promethearchaeia archaeon]